MTPKIEKAIEVALRAHGKQKQRGDVRIPYIVHPISVAMLLIKRKALGTGFKRQLLVTCGAIGLKKFRFPYSNGQLLNYCLAGSWRNKAF